jgi:SAM-dependent methyltransferase
MSSKAPGMRDASGAFDRAGSSLPVEISREVKEGRVLAGDDFTDPQLELWVAQEREAFYHSDAGNSDVDPWYGYMRYTNEILGFSKVPAAIGSKGSILVLGPGSGIEVEHFAQQNPGWSLGFLEASANFRAQLAAKWPQSVIASPVPSGDICLPDSSQKVVCAFSVLHHVANVSKVVREVFRVTSPGGFFLVREPCSSMGDWRMPRSATPNERGIGRDLFVGIATQAGWEVDAAPVPVLFEPINKLLNKTIGYSAIPFGLLYLLDRAISWTAAFNDHYWRDAWYKKFGPSSYFYVLRKPGQS